MSTYICIKAKYEKKYGLEGDEIFDAYLVATEISNGIRYIITDNEADFKKYKPIAVLNPFTIP